MLNTEHDPDTRRVESRVTAGQASIEHQPRAFQNKCIMSMYSKCTFLIHSLSHEEDFLKALYTSHAPRPVESTAPDLPREEREREIVHVTSPWSCVCVSVCMYLYVCVFVSTCVCVHVCVCSKSSLAFYDPSLIFTRDNIWSMQPTQLFFLPFL